MRRAWLALFALLALVALLGAGCGGPAVSSVRFHNRPPAWRVDDRRPLSKKPESRDFVRYLYMFDAYAHRRLTRALEFDAPRRAMDTNSVDDVPDSTWFTHRIVRGLTPEQVARGPNEFDGPDASHPWTVVSSKVGGTTVGFVIKDARGHRYLLKFDRKGFPELETGSDVVGQRLAWACGYHVPQDSVVYFTREQLVVPPEAVAKDIYGDEQPLTDKQLSEALANVDRGDDGLYRGLASRYLDGEPLGGLPRYGTREDDPNDRYPHEHMRVLRGQYTIYSWFANGDMKEDNGNDVWTEDPRHPGQHYLMHYMIDFGGGLGMLGRVEKLPQENFAYVFDFRSIFLSTFTLGLWYRPWEGARFPELRGIGWIEARRFDPGGWRQRIPFTPYEFADRFDKFWGARVVMHFSPAHIRAAVEQGHYSDPRATDYLVATLVERQRKIGDYWFRRVTPLDRFAVERPAGEGGTGGTDQLCFTDLTLLYGLERDAGATRYRLRAYDRAGRALDWDVPLAAPAEGGKSCVGGWPRPQSDQGYTIIRIDTTRGEESRPALEVHLAPDPADDRPRVIGLWRH